MAVLFPLGDRTVLECRAVRKSKSCDIPKSCGHQIKIVKSFGVNPPEYAAKRTDSSLAGGFWSRGGSSYCDMVTNSDASASVAGSTVGTMTDGTMHLLDPAPFGRILPAMVTPMKADGSVDFEAAQKLAKQLVADGADGLVVNGTTGESPTTHMEEKVELVQAVKEVVDVPVISGAGSNDTAHTVRMVEQTQEAGADAVLVVAPYYSRPSQEGVFRHYKAVNDSADKPIIVYDVPGRTGLHIQLETYRRLAELDHVKAVKELPEISRVPCVSVWNRFNLVFRAMTVCSCRSFRLARSALFP